MIIAATTDATTVVARRLTSAPMMSRRRVSSTSGTSANGMPKDSTTWLITSAREGLTPSPSTISAGAIVIARRRTSGIVRSMKPCITTWPAYVPTLELARPDASSASANASAAPPPTRVENWRGPPRSSRGR